MHETTGKKKQDAIPGRRSLLKYGVAGLATAVLPKTLLAQTDVNSLSLANSLQLISSGGVNLLAHTRGNGLILVDSGPARAIDKLYDTLESLQAGPVTTVFNTHWHADQVGGNEKFGRDGARIIAHQKTHQRLSTDYYIPHEQRYQRALPKMAWPTQFFHDRGEISAGNETIEYGWLVQPHTDGDIYVHFRDANVLAVGDALSPERDPELDWYGGGWLGGRVDSQKQLLTMTNADTVIVPSYGPVMSQADLMAEHEFTQALYNRLLDLIREGCSAGCMLNEGALDGLGRTWKNPEKFLYDAYKGLWAHHYNLAPNIL